MVDARHALVADESESPGAAHKVGDVGRYRLIAELARGGMGIVYLALVRGPGGFNKLFVVKILKSHLAEDPKLVSMFLEEARLAAKLSHPNVVQTIEVGSDAGSHFIAMEFLDGQSLHRILARGRRTGSMMALPYQLHVMTHVLEALQYAHGVTDFDGTPLNLVHRDVSPQNVFLTYDGQVKILDFGIAKALDTSSDTRTGMLKGKIAYMAPEQAAGASIDRRADVFAAGVMLWETVVGQRMWDRALNDLQILHALSNGAIPRPRAAAPDLDVRLERIILKAIAFAPADRYASAAEMQLELELYQKDVGAPSFGAREVGRFVSELFAEERAQIKSVIDGQLRLLRRTSSGEYGRVDMPQLSPFTAPGGTPSGVQLAVSLGDPPVFESTRSAIDATSPFGAIRPSPAPPVAPGRTGAIVAVAVGLSLLVGGGAVFLLRSKLAGPPGSVATSQGLPAPSASAPTAPGTVETAAVALAPLSAETSSAAASSAPAPSAAPTILPRVGWGPARSNPAIIATNAATTATAPTPTATQPSAPAAASATATSTAHVRQQIDTSNPYGH